MTRLLLFACLALAPIAASSQSLLLDNFNYTVGSELVPNNGWTSTSGTGTNNITVNASGLSFPNYPGAFGNAVDLTTSGQDVQRAFAAGITAGEVYAAFLVNLSAAQASGDYFFALTPSVQSTSFRGRVFARSSGSGFQFGLSKTSTNANVPPVYTSSEYAFGETYLVVLKYSLVEGADNDTVQLFVLSAVDPIAQEPETPTLADPTTTGDISPVLAVLLRQGSTSSSPTLTIDGIRVGTSWNDAVLATQVVDDGAGYRLLGAPVQNVTVGTLADINLVQSVVGQYPAFPNDNLYLSYNGSGTSGGYVAATSVANPVTPGYGFLWYLFDQDITPSPTQDGGGTSVSYVVPERPLFASGPVNTENVVASFSLNADGFYLLANPFAQALEATGVTQTAGGGTFANTLQLYDPITGYQQVDRTTAASLSMWQGFFAEVQGGTAPTFTYLAASRTDELTPLVSRSAATRVTLALDGQLDVDGAAVATVDRAASVDFADGASAGWDAGDASKLTPPTAAHALVAVVGELNGAARRQALRSVPAGTAATLDVAFTATHAGQFELAALEAPTGWSVVLTDRVAARTADLTQGAYAFTAAAGAWANRFAVEITPSGVVAGEEAPAAVQLSAAVPNPASARATLSLRVDAAQHVTATVVDALGRTVATLFDAALGAGAEQALVVDTARLAPGVYVVRVAGDTFVQSRRLTVAR